MPRRRRSRRATVIVVVVLVVLVVGGLVGAKLYADVTAESQVEERVEELQVVLGDAGPRDFLAFNSGRSVAGSVAQQVADADDFVSVDARADRAMIRFQPKGWWAGFTERCIVALVTDDGVELLALKTACVRVDPGDY
jgi:hypothetical protein